MASKPILTTGVALAGAAAIVAATPAIMPNAAEKTYVATTSVADQGPRQLTVADYELMAVTLPGILDAFFNGYGQIVTEYGGATGPAGVLYYIGEETLLGDIEVDNHFFEAGPYAAAAHLAETAGLSDDVVEFVSAPWNKVRASLVDAVNELTGGTDDEYTLPALLVHEFIHNGGPLAMVQIAVDLIKEIFDPTPPAETQALVVNEEDDASLLDGPDVAKLVSLSAVDEDVEVEDADTEAEVETAKFNPLAGVKLPSFLPEKGEATGLSGLAGAIKDFQPVADEQVEAPVVEVEQPEVDVDPKTELEVDPKADADADPKADVDLDPKADADVDPKAELDAAADETKSKSELRREAANERAQERREAAKERAQERRDAVKERVNDAKDKVRDAVKRATGGGDSDSKKADKKDSAD